MNKFISLLSVSLITTHLAGQPAKAFQETILPPPPEVTEMVQISTPPSVIVNDDRDAVLTKVEDTLNRVRSMKASFVQRGPAGNVDEGTIFLERPGKIRFEYNNDSKQR